MNIAIIPARGGSKRILRKNVKEFCGKPMIVRSIEVALESKCFECVIVSTDDKEIAEVSLSAGAEVPFMRPSELSGDFVGTTPVVGHAIRSLEHEGGRRVEHACCIYATAPFLSAEYLQKGLSIMQNHNYDFAFSVTSYAFPIQRSLKIMNNRVEMFYPEFMNCRSQDLQEAYHDAGQFYWGGRDAWMLNKSIFSPLSYPIILPRFLTQDIDTMEDWYQAELMFNSMNIVT